MERTSIALLLALIWVVATAFSVWCWDAHVILELLFLQYALLLPAAICYASANRGTAESASLQLPPAALVFAGYGIVAVALALYVDQRTATGDSSAYMFESRILLTGHLTAAAPPSIADDEEGYRQLFHFNHHLIYRGRWFGKYPPGWPIVLALGLATGVPWLLNPLLGLVILWTTYRIGLMLFSERIARFAIFLLLVSPFFTFNCIGFMSHPPCSALLALATLFFFRGLKSAQMAHFTTMWAFVAAALLVRPLTAACAGAVLAASTLWALRRTRRRAAVALGLGLALASSATVLLLVFNHALTGSYWRTTYALYRGTKQMIEVNVSPAGILKNLFVLTRWSIEQTLLYAAPFIFVLAGYALRRDEQRRMELSILCSLFMVLVLGYMLQTEPSGTRFGERYYFDSYFAIAVVAARGWELLERSWRTTARVLRIALSFVIVFQIFQYILFGAKARARMRPFASVQRTIESFSASGSVLFLHTGQGFTAQDLNPNAADWMNASVFYVPDPGPAGRLRAVCALKRNIYAVASYDSGEQSARIHGLTSKLECVIH